jgi:SAM-dependent methyltransferase
VLDAGAGLGTHTEAALQGARELVALEPDPGFAQQLRARFADQPRVRIVAGDLASPPDELRGETAFDAAICFNVLEHIRDDTRALGVLSDLLAPGGRLLLLVPAHPALFGATDRALGHERRYTKPELRGKLVEAGFELAELRYVNPVGALGWLVGMRLRRGTAWPARSFGLFERIVPLVKPLDALRLPFGLSLWAVATRRT